MKQNSGNGIYLQYKPGEWTLNGPGKLCNVELSSRLE